MPIQFEDDSTSPFRPQAPQASMFGVEVNRMKPDAEDVSWWTEMGAGFETESWAYRMSREQERTSVEQAMSLEDWNQAGRIKIADSMSAFDPHPFIREEDEGFEDYYAYAANENDIAVIQRRIDHEKETRRIAEEGGWASVIGMMGGAALSPEILIPALGQASKAKSVATIGKVIATNVAADGLHEFINYQTDRTYDPTQIGYALTASALLNGVFGAWSYKGLKKLRAAEGDADKYTTAILDDLEDVGRSFDPNGAPRSVGAASTTEAWELKADDLIRKIHLGATGGVGTKRTFLLPNNLLGALHASKTVRRFTGTLFENNFFYKENAAGKALPASVEARLQKAKGKIVETYYDMEDIFKRYKTDTANPMNRGDFNKAVARAIREGASTDPFVNQAARNYRKKIYEPLLDELQGVGLLKNVAGNPKYVNRVWKREAVIANRSALREKLITFFKTQPDNVGVDDDYLALAADETIKNILGGNQLGANMYGGGAGSPLKQRVLDIPDADIEEFLENDIEKLVDRYVTSTSKAIEKEQFMRANGWETMRDMEDAVREDFAIMRAQLSGEKELQKLEEAQQEALDFINTSMDRMFGTPKQLPGQKGISNAQKVMTLSKLGGVLLSSLGDIARIQQEFGLAGLGNGFKLLLRRATWGAKKQDYGRIGALTERVLQERYNMLAGIDEPTGTGLVSKIIDKLYKPFGTISGIGPWTDGVKTMAVYAAEHNILRHAELKAAGQALDPKVVEELARWGISEDMIDRIGAQYRTHGAADRGMMMSNLENWTDAEAADIFTNALVRTSMNVINTPNKGTLPRIFDSVYGRVIMQFKSFLPTSHVQTLIPMLQGHQAKHLLGTLNMIAIAGMVNFAREEYNAAINDEKANHGDWKKIIIEAVDRSGVASLPFEVNNMSEKALNLGLRPMTDSGVSTRYRNVDAFSAVAGPLPGMVNDVARLSRAATEGDFKPSDINKMWRWLPYQNLWYTKWITEQAKQELRDVVDD